MPEIRSTCKSVLQSGVNETELVGSTCLQFVHFFLDGDWPASPGVTKEKEEKGMDTQRMGALAVCLNEGLCCVLDSNTSFFPFSFLFFRQ